MEQRRHLHVQGPHLAPRRLVRLERDRAPEVAQAHRVVDAREEMAGAAPEIAAMVADARNA